MCVFVFFGGGTLSGLGHLRTTELSLRVRMPSLSPRVCSLQTSGAASTCLDITCLPALEQQTCFFPADHCVQVRRPTYQNDTETSVTGMISLHSSSDPTEITKRARPNSERDAHGYARPRWLMPLVR